MSRIFLDLFRSKSQILEVRGEKLYFPYVLKALTDFRRYGEPFTVRYSLAAIESVRPQMVITGTDNSYHFYRLKPLVRVSNVKFVAVQNARRFTIRDIFEHPPIAEVGADIVFVFSEAVASQFSRWL